MRLGRTWLKRVKVEAVKSGSKLRLLPCGGSRVAQAMIEREEDELALSSTELVRYTITRNSHDLIFTLRLKSVGYPYLTLTST